jgi:hypothetical protein
MHIVEAHKAEEYLFVDSSGTVLAHYDPEHKDPLTGAIGCWRFQLSSKAVSNNASL